MLEFLMVLCTYLVLECLTPEVILDRTVPLGRADSVPILDSAVGGQPIAIAIIAAN